MNEQATKSEIVTCRASARPRRNGAVFALALALGFTVPAAGVFDRPAQAASKIVTLVNNVPITTNDVARRAAFFKLRRMKGNHRKLAKEELIEEALKMQEARRIRAVVSDRDVDAAFARFAKGNKMPERALRDILNRSGVTVRGFKQYIRAQMSWQRALGARMQAESRPTKEAGPLDHLHGQGRDSGSNRTTEYTLQQIIFVVPRDQMAARQNARLREAQNFRTRFPGCEGSLSYAASLRDVTVRDRGRVQAHELPSEWLNAVKGVSPGKTTKPQKTARGVEMLAVCRTREVLSKAQSSGADGDLFSGGDRQVSALEKKYLEELRKAAVIKDR
ncbi:SurA N-terminal domain-containing protein [Pseudahrensia aquimaris]|uniref:SurA N-terminal domain-containing protein n=1 Tax=Pseudahrensia aquimaris TaxID=744461 RepID=A0ABW3FBW3_9HYPH